MFRRIGGMARRRTVGISGRIRRRKFEIAKPEFTANRGTSREALNGKRQERRGTRHGHLRVNLLPEVGIVQRVTGKKRSSGISVAQNNLRPACSFKVRRLVVRREV